jgi:GH24 family phage-related lysozyme (muramidase)
MVSSYKPSLINPLVDIRKIPSRTLRTLSYLDQGDPNVATLSGDTPGPLGSYDWVTLNHINMPGPLGSNDGAIPSYIDVLSSNRMGLHDGQCRVEYGTMPAALAMEQSALPDSTLPGTATTLNWNDVETDFEHWEGKFPHMYLDTKGLITVGIGKMLPNVAAAKALGFVRRSDGAIATAAEIEIDFLEVSKQPRGKLAKRYKKHTQLDLPDDLIYSLLRTVVNGFENDLVANFDGYRTYPINVKRALLDMIYNLGLRGLLKFKNLKKSVESRDWKEAAKHCHRIGPSKERNDWTRDLFLSTSN